MQISGARRTAARTAARSALLFLFLGLFRLLFNVFNIRGLSSIIPVVEIWTLIKRLFEPLIHFIILNANLILTILWSVVVDSVSYSRFKRDGFFFIVITNLFRLLVIGIIFLLNRSLFDGFYQHLLYAWLRCAFKLSLSRTSLFVYVFITYLRLIDFCVFMTISLLIRIAILIERL